MASGAQNDRFDSMFEEIEYLKEIFNSMESSSIRRNFDWSEIVREQDSVLNKLRGDFAGKMTHLEQRLNENTLRITGLVEGPGENTLLLVLRYFQKRLKVSVSDTDIESCRRVGPIEQGFKIRPIVVEFKNDEARKRVWERKAKVKDSVHFSELLCYERNKVRQIAVQVFGRDRVSVVQGVVQVRMDDGKEMKFYTMSQIIGFFNHADSPVFSGDKCKKK